MPLPTGLSVILVTADFSELSGSGQDGFVIFDPGQAVTDAAGHSIFTGATVRQVKAGVMDPVTLPCTDNTGLAPSGFVYKVTERVGAQVGTYSIALPSTLGADVDLAALRPVAPPPANSSYGSNNTWTGTQLFAGNPPMVIPGGTSGDVLTVDSAGHVTPQPAIGGGTIGSIDGGSASSGQLPVSALDGGSA